MHPDEPSPQPLNGRKDEVGHASPTSNGTACRALPIDEDANDAQGGEGLAQLCRVLARIAQAQAEDER
jgi:hypothetical protein